MFYEELNKDSARIMTISDMRVLPKENTLLMYPDGLQIEGKVDLYIQTDFTLPKRNLNGDSFFVNRRFTLDELTDKISKALEYHGFQGITRFDDDTAMIMYNLYDSTQIKGNLAVLQSEGYLRNLSATSVKDLTNLTAAGLFFNHYERLNKGHYLADTGVYKKNDNMRIVHRR